MKALQNIGCTGRVAVLLYGVVGLLLLGQYSGKIINYMGSTSWEQVDGVVVASEVQNAWDTTGDRFLPLVTYSYTVEGETYEGSQIDLRGPIYVGNEEAAAAMIEPYPIGAEITLFADPNDPANAVITRDVQPAIWWFAGIGTALLALSVGLGATQFGGRSAPKSSTTTAQTA